MSKPANTSRSPLAPGSMRNQCPSCGLLFGGLTGFDRHRTGTFGTPSGRRCMTPAELEKIGLKEGPNGYWSRPVPTVTSGPQGRSLKTTHETTLAT